MAEENTAAPTGIGRRKILIIAAAGLGSIFLVTGLILGILYFTGALSGNDEIIERLNAIEGGAPWPSGAHHAKAAFLPKDPDHLADPMAYRVLLILPTLYRKWAATRLHELYPWVDTWSNPYLFAGIPGFGAADGWFLTQPSKWSTSPSPTRPTWAGQSTL